MDWTHIHQRYESIPRKPGWMGADTFEELEKQGDVRCYHMLGSKPWELDPSEWPDLRPWWDKADRLVAAHPDLQDRIRGGSARFTPLDAEFYQLRLTQDLQAFVHAKVRGDHRLRYEANNILERWILSMANSGLTFASDDTDTKLSWATIYHQSSPDDPFNRKMAGELLEKAIASSAKEADEIMERVVKTVNTRISTRPPATKAEPDCDMDDSVITFGSRFHTEMSPRLRLLAQRHACSEVVRMTMRYEAVISGGQQWGLPQAHFDALYSKAGVRNECIRVPDQLPSPGEGRGEVLQPVSRY